MTNLMAPGQLPSEEVALRSLYERLSGVIDQFEDDPPQNDYQRGYLAAVQELRKEVLLASGKPHPRSVC
jgi:hypothetical protein